MSQWQLGGSLIAEGEPPQVVVASVVAKKRLSYSYCYSTGVVCPQHRQPSLNILGEEDHHLIIDLRLANSSATPKYNGGELTSHVRTGDLVNPIAIRKLRDSLLLFGAVAAVGVMFAEPLKKPEDSKQATSGEACYGSKIVESDKHEPSIVSVSLCI